MDQRVVCSIVKLVVQVRLLPTPEQAAALAATLSACNTAANFASATAFTTGARREYGLRKHVYRELKARGLGAQTAQHVIKKVADAYTTLKANLRNGNYGPPGSARRTAIEGKPIAFRAQAGQPFDDRCLSWQIDTRTVSIWTTAGRMRDIAFTASAEQLTMLAVYRKGESDLVCRDGMWFLCATCQVPDPPVATPEGLWAWIWGSPTSRPPVTASATRRGLNAVRHRQRQLRARLQAKPPSPPNGC